jgi:hypothetical protein
VVFSKGTGRLVRNRGVAGGWLAPPSLRDLRERIEQVRAAYLATLTAWPEEMPRVSAGGPEDA